MPKVGEKHYPYTEEGYRKAANARKKKIREKLDKKLMKRRKKNA